MRGHTVILSVYGAVRLTRHDHGWSFRFRSVQEAKADAQVHASSLYQEPDYPLVGSAYYCKSRSEYELEAQQGPLSPRRAPLIALWRLTSFACLQHRLRQTGESGYFFCQDYVDYAAACDAAGLSPDGRAALSGLYTRC